MKKKSAFTFLCFSILILGSVASIKAPNFRDRNLQVLPKDISDVKLDSIMESYTKALGVGCNFCHVSVQGAKDSLDFASDKEPMKEEARNMMRMVIDINTKYFYYDKNKHPVDLNTITCITCHKGDPYPIN